MNDIVDSFYHLMPLSNTKAETIYSICTTIREDGLSLKKLIGIGTDGANTMLGKNNSVATMLKKDNDDLVVFKCVCHSLHLAASKASSTLPTVLDFMVRETHNWFSCSPKLCHNYKELYNVMEGKSPLKIAGMANTRRLARLEAVSAIIEQYDVLKLHFQMASSKERCYTTSMIKVAFKDPQNLCYLLFMRKILKEVIMVNRLFQSNQRNIVKLTHDLTSMVKNLMSLIVLPQHMIGINNDNMNSVIIDDKLIPTDSLHLGYEFMNQITSSNLLDNQIKYMKERFKMFVLELVTQCQQRLPDNIKTLLMLLQFTPENILKSNKSD